MRLDHLAHHVSRRQLLKAGAVGAAVSAAAPGLLAGAARAQTDRPNDEDVVPGAGRREVSADGYDDGFSVAGALDGSWAAATASRYGPDDQRGTLNEITPHKTAMALALLKGGREVATYNLGHVLRNGFPAWRTFPIRRYEQRLTVRGYEPKDGDRFFTTTVTGNAGEDEWRAADRARGPLGYFQGTTGIGSNRVSIHEERLIEPATYQIATQLDNLNHIGVGEVFYNGYRGPDLATPTGTSKLGAETMGPFVTRGLLVDVLGLKQSQGESVQVVEGKPMLADTYRIALDDIVAAMKRAHIGGIEPGDVVLIRTGWHQLAESPDTYDKYLDTEPGIWVREAKYFADHRPALVGADTWGLEVAGNPVSGDIAFPCHQELITKNGIRIGEGIITDELAEDGIFEFVYAYSPLVAAGATAGNTPPVALAKKR